MVASPVEKEESDWRGLGLNCLFFYQFFGNLISLNADVSWHPDQAYLIIFNQGFQALV